MISRSPKALEKRWLSLVGQLPCIVCRYFHDEPNSPAEIHHLFGKTRRGAHLFIIPLCANHHRNADSFAIRRWVSRHGDGKRAFERRYDKEEMLLQYTDAQVARMDGWSPKMQRDVLEARLNALERRK